MNYYTRKELLNQRARIILYELESHRTIMVTTIKEMKAKESKLLADYRSIQNEAQSLAEQNEIDSLPGITDLELQSKPK